jgi:hypothetical protein
MLYIQVMKKHLKDYFIPHEGNDHKPHSLRTKSVGLLFFAVLLIQAVFLGTLLVKPGVISNYLAAVLPSVLVEKTNEERIDNSQNILVVNPLLVQAAQQKANDMAARGYFAHVTPEGRDPWFFLDQVGYRYQAAGENLAVNFVDSDQAHKAWMNSPTHRENIVRNDFTEIGIATAQGEYQGKKTIFVAQFFGRPQPQSSAVQYAQPNVNQFSQKATIEEYKALLAEAERLLAELNNQEGVEGSTEVLGLFDQSYTQYERPNIWTRITSSPSTLIMSGLLLLGVFVLMALVVKMIINVHIQHKTLIVQGALLLVVIFSFLYFNESILAYTGTVQGL